MGSGARNHPNLTHDHALSRAISHQLKGVEMGCKTSAHSDAYQIRKLRAKKITGSSETSMSKYKADREVSSKGPTIPNNRNYTSLRRTKYA